MHFLSVAVVAVLLCAAAAYAEKTPLEEATELRQYAKCIDGIMNEMAGEHKKIAKRYPEFKELAEKTNLQLDECLKINDVESNISKAECVEDTILMFSMLKVSELITALRVENEELSEAFTNAIITRCSD